MSIERPVRAHAEGNVMRFSLAILFATLAFAQQSAKDLFDDTRIHEIHIRMSDDDWALLRQNYLDNTYYQATVSSESQTVPDVGIRSRGRGSRSPDKPNFTIKANKFVKKQKFAGLEFFQLKANNQDPSTLHETITFKLFRKMGLPAPREAPARVYINDQYFGFYMIVENEDEDFLDRNLGESKGDLFEWKPNDYYYFEDRGTDPQAYAQFLDPQTNEDNPDLQKFADMVQAINHSSAADFVSAVSPYLDLKMYLTHVAAENAVAEFDGIWGDTYGTNNFDLYRFADQDLFTFITWDKDFTFDQPDRLPFAGSERNVLARRLLAIPEYRNYYLSQFTKAIDLLGGSGGWADQEVTRLYTLIRDAATNDPHKHCSVVGGGIAPCGAADFERGIRDMRSFIAERRTFIHSILPSLGYSPVSEPALRSVSFEPLTSGDALVPGSLAVVRGSGLSDLPEWTDAPPRTNGRTFIAIDGVRAPIISMNSDQAVIQIPWDIPTGTAPVAISSSGMSNTAQTAVVPEAPAILAVEHADGKAVTAEAPARPGEALVVYATGLGEIDAELSPGAAAASNVLVHLREIPEVRLGNNPVQVLFAGLAPGYIGLYQVNLVVPADYQQEGAVSLTIGPGNPNANVTVIISEQK